MTKSPETPEGYTPVEPVVWKAEEIGDSIQGKVLYRTTENSKFGNTKLFIQTESGAQFLIFCPTALETKLALVRDGEDVLIRYDGVDKKYESKGNPLHLYSVYRKNS